MSYRVRYATIDDLHDILRIWTLGVQVSLGSSPPAGPDYKKYFGRRLLDQDDRFRFFVVADGAETYGWLSLSPFRSNPAVKGIMAELSAYVDPQHVSKGVASTGFSTVLAHADESALEYVVAFTLETNDAVLRLTDKFGFKRVGTLPPNSKRRGAPGLVYLARACEGARRGGATGSE